MPMLIHILGGAAEDSDQPQVFDLSSQELFIGRLSELSIQIQDDSISRRHARVYRQDGQWHIEDLHSTNGIFINGQQTVAGQIVEGDIITVGDIYFTLSDRQPEQVWEMEEWVRERRARAEEFRQHILQQVAPVTAPSAVPIGTPSPKPLMSISPPAKAPAIIPKKAPAWNPPPPASTAEPRRGSGPAWVPPAGATPGVPKPTYDPQLSVTPEFQPAPTVVNKDPVPMIIGITLAVLLAVALIWKFVFQEKDEKPPASPPPAGTQWIHGGGLPVARAETWSDALRGMRG